MTREEARKMGEILTETLSQTFGLSDAQREERERNEQKRLKEARKAAKAEKRFREHEDQVFGDLCGIRLRG